MLKKILIIIPLIILLLCAGIVILHWQTDIISDFSKNIINDNLREVAEVEYSSLEGDLFQNIIIKDLVMTFPDGLQIKSNKIIVDYSLTGTLSGNYFFDSIHFDSLDVFIPPSKTIDDTNAATEDNSIQQTLNRLASSIPLKTFLESLPQLEIDNLDISNGKISFASIKRTFQNIELNMSARHRGESIELNIARLSGIEKSRDFYLEHFRAQIIGNMDRINLNRLEIQTPESIVHAHLEITIGDSLWVIVGIEETHLTVRDIETVSGAEIADSGYIDLDLDLVGHPNRFSLKLISKGRYNTYWLDSLIVDGDYERGEIQLRRGLMTRDTSLAFFKGKIGEYGNNLTFRFRHLNLLDVYPGLIPTNMTGSLYVRTKSLKQPFIDSEAELNVIKSTVDTLVIDTLRLAIDAFENDIKIRQPSFFRAGKQSIFVVEGEMDRNDQVYLKISTTQNAVETLTASVGLPQMTGSFDGNFFITGNVSDPDFECYLWIPHLEKDSFKLDSMIFNLGIKRIGSSRKGEGSAIASHWQYDNLDITETIARVFIDSNRVIIDTLLFANQENYISSKGMLEARYDTLDLVFNFFRTSYQNSWLQNDENLHIRFTPDEHVIEQAMFNSSGEGLIEIRGYWDIKNDEMQFGLYFEDINLTPFKQFMAEEINLSGIISADIEVINPQKDLELDVEIFANELNFNNAPFGNVHSAFKYRQQQLYINEFKMVQGGTTLDIDGDVAVQWGDEGDEQLDILEESLADVKIYWKNLRLQDYATLLNLPRTLKGEVSGELSLAGTVSDPSGRLVLLAQKIEYDKFNTDSLDLLAHFNRDSLIIEQVAMDLNKTDLRGKGWQLLNLDFTNLDSIVSGLPFQLELESKDNQISFIGNIMDQVERVEGPYEAFFTLGGTLDKPSLVSGSFQLEDGKLILSRIGNPITQLQIDATIDSSRMNINSLYGFAGKNTDFWEDAFGVVKSLFRLIRGDTRAEGELFGEGYIDLTDLSRPEINLSLEAYNVYLDYFVENTNMVVTTNDLRVFGQDTLNIEGNITIEEGEYVVDLTTFQKNIYLSHESKEKGTPIAWNLDLTIPGNYIITSSRLDLLNNFKFEIMGDFRAIQEAHAPNMDLTGHMEVISGKYGSWGQNFGIETGTIDFTDPKVINPDINIRAQKRAGDYYVELNVVGKLDELKQEVQIKDENGNYLTNLSDQEVLGLVTLGRTNFDVAGVGGNVISTSVETAIERGAESVTGLDKVEVDSRSQSNRLEFESISLGKYLTSNLYIEYTGMFSVPSPNVSYQPGNQIGLEYRINKNWSIDSNYFRTQRGNSIYRISLAWKTSF
jgi:hypothetical protein